MRACCPGGKGGLGGFVPFQLGLHTRWYVASRLVIARAVAEEVVVGVVRASFGAVDGRSRS
jgi:hypothetical protein